MKTVADVLFLIHKNIESAPEAIANHNRGLLGKRTRGSTTEKGLEDIPPKTPLEWYTRSNGADVYIGYESALGGKLGAVPLRDVIAKETISIREGEHGPELFINRPESDIPNPGIFDTAGAKSPNVSLFSVIVGESDGVRTVFTWHPGYILEPFDGKTFTKSTAVKLHNG